MKRGKSTQEPPPLKHPKKRPKLQNYDLFCQKEEDKDIIIDSNTFIRPDPLPELFNQWRNFLIRDSFTDLKVICENDYYGGLSLHKAILASCSTFMASILCDGRDETTLLLPEVDREDFHNLVRNLYGETGVKRPSLELLTLLRITKLPDEFIQTTISDERTTSTCKSTFLYLKYCIRIRFELRIRCAS